MTRLSNTDFVASYAADDTSFEKIIQRYSFVGGTITAVGNALTDTYYRNTITSIGENEIITKVNSTDISAYTFDGTDWIVYNTSNSGLPDNDHVCLSIDAQGNIWSGTEGGL